LLSQLARLDLAGLHIRLIKRIDADDRSGHRRGNFPAEKFLAEVMNRRQRDVNDRMTRRDNLFEVQILTAVIFRFEL